MRAQSASGLAAERAEAASAGAIVVFTDIEGSTDSRSASASERWLEMLLEHNRLMRACVARSDGRVVKSTRDGEIVISAAARRLLGTATEVGRPRQVLLRGLSHPQVIHLVRWRSPNLAPLTTRPAVALAQASPAPA